MNKKMFRKFAIAAATVAMLLANMACDEGGTIRPDSGCIGQAANYESCVETVNATGEIITEKVEQALP